MAIEVELALIPPPLGVIVFLLHRLYPQISIGQIFRGVTPFIVANLLALVLLTLFPQLALWLPHLIMK